MSFFGGGADYYVVKVSGLNDYILCFASDLGVRTAYHTGGAERLFFIRDKESAGGEERFTSVKSEEFGFGCGVFNCDGAFYLVGVEHVTGLPDQQKHIVADIDHGIYVRYPEL